MAARKEPGRKLTPARKLAGKEGGSQALREKIWPEKAEPRRQYPRRQQEETQDEVCPQEEIGSTAPPHGGYRGYIADPD